MILRTPDSTLFPYTTLFRSDKLDLRYPYTYLGAGSDTLSQLLDGKNEFFGVLKKAEKPLILVGQAALVGQNGEAILKAISKLCDEVGALSDTWNGLGILQTAASRVGGLDIGFSSNLGADDIVKSSEVLFLLGADEINQIGRASCRERV